MIPSYSFDNSRFDGQHINLQINNNSVFRPPTPVASSNQFSLPTFNPSFSNVSSNWLRPSLFDLSSNREFSATFPFSLDQKLPKFDFDPTPSFAFPRQPSYGSQILPHTLNEFGSMMTNQNSCTSSSNANWNREEKIQNDLFSPSKSHFAPVQTHHIRDIIQISNENQVLSHITHKKANFDQFENSVQNSSVNLSILGSNPIQTFTSNENNAGNFRLESKETRREPKFTKISPPISKLFSSLLSSDPSPKHFSEDSNNSRIVNDGDSSQESPENVSCDFEETFYPPNQPPMPQSSPIQIFQSDHIDYPMSSEFESIDEENQEIFVPVQKNSQSQQSDEHVDSQTHLPSSIDEYNNEVEFDLLPDEFDQNCIEIYQNESDFIEMSCESTFQDPTHSADYNSDIPVILDHIECPETFNFEDFNVSLDSSYNNPNLQILLPNDLEQVDTCCHSDISMIECSQAEFDETSTFNFHFVLPNFLQSFINQQVYSIIRDTLTRQEQQFEMDFLRFCCSKILEQKFELFDSQSSFNPLHDQFEQSISLYQQQNRVFEKASSLSIEIVDESENVDFEVQAPAVENIDEENVQSIVKDCDIDDKNDKCGQDVETTILNEKLDFNVDCSFSESVTFDLVDNDSLSDDLSLDGCTAEHQSQQEIQNVSQISKEKFSIHSQSSPSCDLTGCSESTIEAKQDNAVQCEPKTEVENEQKLNFENIVQNMPTSDLQSNDTKTKKKSQGDLLLEEVCSWKELVKDKMSELKNEEISLMMDHVIPPASVTFLIGLITAPIYINLEKSAKSKVETSKSEKNFKSSIQSQKHANQSDFEMINQTTKLLPTKKRKNILHPEALATKKRMKKI